MGRHDGNLVLRNVAVRHSFNEYEPTNLGPNEGYVVKVANDSKTLKVNANKSAADAGT